jgi:hypothetical protein
MYYNDLGYKLETNRAQNPSYRLHFEDICSGNQHYQKYSTLKKELKCRIVNHYGYLTLSPVKEELLHQNPHIYMFHDLITNKQSESIKNKSFYKVIYKIYIELFHF